MNSIRPPKKTFDAVVFPVTRIQRALPVLWLPPVLMLAACGHHEPVPSGGDPVPVREVRVMTVQRSLQPVTEEVVGTIRPALRAMLESKISGRIEKMLVAPGDSVTNGQLLAELDVREIQAQLDQALAQRDQADSDLKRLSSLFEQQAVTQQEYDAVKIRRRIAGASVEEAETFLAYSRITAPFDGIVNRKLGDVGDLALPGKALIEIEDPKSLRFEADVPGEFVDKVQLGSSLRVRIASSETGVNGVVSEISPSADPVSRTFRFKLDLPASASLRSGQFGRLDLPIAERSVLLAPRTAVIKRGQLEIVFVVINQKASLRLVRTGRGFRALGSELLSAGDIELVSGIEEGETIVVEGASHLTDGQPVRAAR